MSGVRNSLRYSLYKAILPAINIARLHNFLRSNAAVINEGKRQIALGLSTVIHPFSNFSFLWQNIMVINYFVTFIVCPLEVANHFLTHLDRFFFNFGTLMTVLHSVFICDIIIQCRTGYCDMKSKTIVLEPLKIAKNYLKTYFIFDMLSTVPVMTYTILVYFLHIDLGKSRWRFLALLKIIRGGTFETYRERLWERLGFLDMLHRVMELFMKTFFFCHWAALVLLISPFVFEDVTPVSNNTWIHDVYQHNFSTMDFDQMYLKSIYHIVGVTLGHAGLDRAPSITETIITIIFQAIGFVFIGYIFSEIMDMMISKLHSETKYDEFMIQLGEYMRHKELSLLVQDQLVSFYEFKHRHVYFNEAAIKKSLSERLRKEITASGCEKMLRAMDIYKHMSTDDVAYLVQHLTPQLYLPKDQIIRAGNVGEYLFFLACGTVALYTARGKEICHLFDGSSFGEVALVMKDRKHIASVFAVEICEVYVLDRYAFQRKIAHNEEIYKVLLKQAKARVRLARALAVNDEVELTNQDDLPEDEDNL